MPSLVRRLINLVTAGSLLLCVAVAALWVRSYFAFDWVKLSETVRVSSGPGDRGRPEAGLLFSWPGAFGYVRSPLFWEPERAGSFRLVPIPRTLRDDAQNAETEYLVADMRRRLNRWGTPRFDHGGFQFAIHWKDDLGMHVVVPYWSAFALTAVAPAVWLVGALRRRRSVREGTCGACGYDLRATPHKCPECGLVPG